MSLKLVKLSYKYKEMLEEMLEEWIIYNNSNKDANHSPWAIFKNDYKDFDYYLENLESKEDLSLGKVQDSTLFLLDSDRNIFLGAVNIRHSLNEGLLYDGGHIGDGIRPRERGKGYATKMLSLSLDECKKIGLKRVLVVCNQDNVGSKKHIIKNGGIKENEVVDVDTGVIEERYWIELSNYNYLKSNNIVLRKARMDDLEVLYKTIWNNPEIYEKMWFKPTLNLEDAKTRMLRTINYQASNDAYIIALKDSDTPIGFCGIKEDEPNVFSETGICVNEENQGKGYGKEALHLLLDLVFNKYNGSEFIYASMKDNFKSKGLKSHFDFKPFKVNKEIREWDNKEFELEYYKLKKEDF